MTPSARRIVIPLFVIAVVIGMVALMVLSRPAATPATPAAPDESTVATTPAETPDAAPDAAPTAATDEAPALPPSEDAGDPALALRARAPGAPAIDPDALGTLGSLDPAEAPMLLRFSPTGAGIDRITLSDQWATAMAKQRAEAHRDAVAAGDADPPPLPSDDKRLLLAAAEELRPSTEIPVLAAHSVVVNGQRVFLLFDVDPETGARRNLWTETAPGSFETVIVDEQDRPVLRIARTFTVGTKGEIDLQQRVENLAGRPLDIQWQQFGPSDMRPDRTGYIDRRRFRFGHLLSPERDPGRSVVIADKSLLEERTTIIKNPEEPLWPTKETLNEGYELSWFASTSRYFTLTVHPRLDENQQGRRSIAHVVETITHESTPGSADDAIIFTLLASPVHTVAAGSTLDLSLGVYAGPMERKRLRQVEPYASLGMRYLILYQMSSCCSACTFQWLAELLINFLQLVHDYVLFDWGLAIILLVCVVRGLLHPLTKRAQINMHSFSSRMGKLKPELDKLQQKYRDEPKKFQTEQLRLMREHGISPTQFLGCLPMFLQTPIWIALYAMLYFAFEIRQEPAFYGVFQSISGGSWRFLGDLSRADRFIVLFDEPKIFKLGLFFDYSSINILPLLMGILFFIQQKYMTPPPSPGMSKEQLQQQKIMKVMMVIMMPVFLYSAPSGLTLYILTSSTIGILEGRYVRAHIKELELNPPKDSGKKSKSRDALGRAYAAAMERAEEKRREKKQPRKTYKKRKK